MAALRVSTIVAPGVKLGSWASNVRCRHRAGRLAPWLTDALDALPGWSWDPIADEQRRTLALLRRAVARHGWAAIRTGMYSTRVTEAGVLVGAGTSATDRSARAAKLINLGWWVTSRRVEYRKGKLSPDIARELEAIPGWAWERHDEIHRQHLALVRDLLAALPRRARGRTWPGTSPLEELLAFGNWLETRRREARRQTIDPGLKRELARLLGAAWSRPFRSSR